jgi:hypothetical protein
VDRDCAEKVRESCRAVAARSRHVRIDLDALDVVAGGDAPGLDPVTHYVDGSREDVAAYILVLDAVNFGSGWFHELPGFGYDHVAGALAGLWRDGGGLNAARLRAIDRAEVGLLLGAPADHELIGLYARALNELGDWLGARTALDVVQAAEGSAQALASMLAELPMWRDSGFLKRAQIAGSDLALAGVANFTDLDRLTAFADNVLPQVLRRDGVLQLSADLAAAIDRGALLPAGGAETELRACAVHACELLAARLGMTPREIDNVLWTRGQQPAYSDTPAHRTHTTFY